MAQQLIHTQLHKHSSSASSQTTMMHAAHQAVHVHNAPHGRTALDLPIPALLPLTAGGLQQCNLALSLQVTFMMHLLLQ
jgi:hypothetical protein